MSQLAPGTIMLRLVILVIAVCSCRGFLFGRDQSNWNGLKVTWGVNPLSSFNSVPRTKAEAVSHGWVNLAPGDSCDSNPNFLGERFWKDGDLGVILIYGPNGYIAGMQAGIAKSYSPNPNGYPFAPLMNSPFILEGDNYYVTSYFVNPAHLCNGRSATEFHAQGTGEGVWIQNGTNPKTSSMRIPLHQSEADTSMWTKGVCFYSMGHHYWYNLSKGMNCDNLFPMFLLYNNGVLNGWGWAFAMNIENSKRFEHPPLSSYSNFMAEVPDCLAGLGTMTTLHVYMTDSAIADLC